jgi:hypothetical protein
LSPVKFEGLNLRRPIYMARNAGAPPTREQVGFWSYVEEKGREPADKIRHDLSLMEIVFACTA